MIRAYLHFILDKYTTREWYILMICLVALVLAMELITLG